MHLLEYSLLIFGFANLAESLFLNKNQCPTAVAKANFDFTAFSNSVWFEKFKYPNANQTTDGCSNWSFSGTSPSFQMQYGTQTMVNNSPQGLSTVRVPFTMSDPTVGVFTGTWPWSSADIVVLDTDYTSYAVLYSCSSKFLSSKTEYAWVLQISTLTTVNVNFATIAAASGITIDPAALIVTYQDSNYCNY